MKSKINNKELEIFSRQLILNDFKDINFEKIRKNKIVLVGVGGIGCPIAQYLISCGIINLTLIDNDVVNLSNLNRQILFNQKDLGKKKVNIAKKKLNLINSLNNIKAIDKLLTKKNIAKYFSKSSLIIDTTDNWSSMSMINQYCTKNNIPLLSCSVIGYDGQVVLFKNDKKKHLCLKCIYPIQKDPDLPRCDTVGVIGTAAGLTGLIATQLTINFFTNNHKNIEKLLMINTKSLQLDLIKIKKNNNCILQ
mgnify:CR=1 FL=1